MLVTAAVLAAGPHAFAQDARIISLIGTGETRAQAAQDWRAAAVRQALAAGEFVRTLDASQMALLLTDQTQLRLNQNSMLQVRSLAAGGQPTRLTLTGGRSWMQRRSVDVRQPSAPPPALEIETPNAVAAIRGTEFELVVQDSGVATLTVFSGEAEFYNPFGTVTVLANEQATVQPGQAPVKILLTQARDRIQWVTAYQPQPMRWGASQVPNGAAVSAAIESGRFAAVLPQLQQGQAQNAGTAAVLADLLLAQGEIDAAVQVLDAARPRFPDAGQLDALLARTYVIAGRAADAAALLAGAQQRHPQTIEVWLAAGDLARYEGRWQDANAAYLQALAIDDSSAPAWFGLGVVASERENVGRGREYLGEALERAPAGPGYQGEAGTLETFADNFPAAARAFEVALASRPDDYVALTGQGLMYLKRGDTDAALASFLQAGVVEPRYARAVVYTGVAYYQQGQTYAARERLARAAELDPRDPLPYILQSVVATDAIEPGAAVDAAREAVERLPYLKSLNQLLNNQKGSANVGAALAAFGLEEWAQHYAYASYNPFWAGSHLFLADRFNGTFNKNSELFQGFLSDPTVFGASTRFSTLLPRPGDYATVAVRGMKQAANVGVYQATANGYHNRLMPLAYYAEHAGAHARPAAGTLHGDVRLTTVGLGARPRHDVGIFLFATHGRLDSLLTDAAAGFDRTPQDGRQWRTDLGANVKFSPGSQSWFKAGVGRERRTVAGVVTDTVAYNTLSELFPLNTFSDTGDYSSLVTVDAYDAQFRHVVDYGAWWQFGVGVEHGRQSLPIATRQDLPTDAGLFYYGMRERTVHRSTDTIVTNRVQLHDRLLLQADLAAQHLKREFRRTQFFGVVDLFEDIVDSGEDDDVLRVNPRIGTAWQTPGGGTLRFAVQQWRRPAMQNSLAPIDTAGVTLDDRLVAVGGRLRRARAQYEQAVGERTFVSLFADRRRIDNFINPGGTLVTGIALDTLDRLRRLFTTDQGAVDVYEDTPDFAAGRVRSGGVTVNRILGPRLAVAGSYARQQSRSTAAGAAPGTEVPLIPRHLVQVGATWIPLPRVKVDAVSIYRTARYVDEANSGRLAAGWNTAMRAYWESPAKRFGVMFRAENILSRSEAGFEREPLLVLQLTVRP